MDKTIVKTERAPAAIGPYSQAVVVGNTIYASGQIPIDPKTGEIVAGNVEEQAKQVLENVKSVLEAAEFSLENVVKTTVFIKDMNQFAQINAIYATYFKEPFPARSTVEIARLPKDVLLEIEVIAVK